MPDDQMLTTTQVPQHYPFLTVARLRYWRHCNEGPASFKVGGRVLYRKSALDAWIAQQEAASVRGGDAA